MKRLLFTLSLFFALTLHRHTVSAQDTLNPDWVIHKTPVTDVQGEAWSVTPGSDGYLYWATGQTMVDQFKDIVLYKLDTAGTEIWAQPGMFRFTQTEQAYVVTESNGVVYTGGRICDCVDINLTCCDLLLVAWDAATGDTLWHRRYDVSGEYEECDGLVVEDSTIFATGWTRASQSTWFDVLLMRTDLNGDTLWMKSWDEGIQKDERQDGHIHVDATNIYCTGVSEGVPSTVVPLSGLDGSATLWKFDRDGNYVDHTTWGYNGAWIDVDDALGMGSDGTYLYAIGYVSPSGSNTDWFIRKYDKNLNLIWEDEWGGFSGEAGRAITFDDQGNLWTAVNTNSYADSSQNVALLQYSPSGNLLGFHLWGASGDESVQDIRYHQGALYLSGSGNSNPQGKTRPFLIKISVDKVTGREEALIRAFEIASISPNPATDHLDVEMKASGAGKLNIQLLDVSGKEIHRWEQTWNIGRQAFRLDLPAISKGLYFLRFESENHSYTHNLLISGGG